MSGIEALIDEYTRRYGAHDVDGVVDLCRVPFLAVREGRPIHLADREATRSHFASVMDAYRTAGYASFEPIEVDVHALGERSAFATVRWHARAQDGTVARDSLTTYHLNQTDDGWRFLSYTNHF